MTQLRPASLALALAPLVLATLSTLGAVPHEATRPRASHGDECIAEWSSDRGLPSDGHDVSIENLEIAQWHNRIIGVGDPVLRWNSTGSNSAADLMGGVAWADDGRMEVLPPFAPRIVMYPRAATTSDGVMHVVYGTTKDLSNRTWTTPPDTLWHVQFDGRRWSVPEPIPSSASGSYWWENLSPSGLVAWKDELYLAVPIRSRDRTTIALLHRDSHARWQLLPVTTGSALAAYVRLARLRDVLILTWAGPDPTLPTDRASVFAMRSTTGGQSWSAPMRLHLAGRGTTYDHALLVDSSDRAYLLWRQQNGDPQRPSDAVGLAWTEDAGFSWHELRPLSVPSGLSTLHAALTSYGPVALYSEINAPGVRLSILRRGHWITPKMRPTAIPANDVAVLRRGGDSIAVIGATTPPTDDALPRSSSKSEVARRFNVAIHCHL